MFKDLFIPRFETPPAKAIQKGYWMEYKEGGMVIRALYYRGITYIISLELW